MSFFKKSFVIKTFIAFCVVIFISCFNIARIDSGQTGVMVNLAGSSRGVDEANIETGWVIYNRFTIN